MIRPGHLCKCMMSMSKNIPASYYLAGRFWTKRQQFGSNLTKAIFESQYVTVSPWNLVSQLIFNNTPRLFQKRLKARVNMAALAENSGPSRHSPALEKSSVTENNQNFSGSDESRHHYVRFSLHPQVQGPQRDERNSCILQGWDQLSRFLSGRILVVGELTLNVNAETRTVLYLVFHSP